MDDIKEEVEFTASVADSLVGFYADMLGNIKQQKEYIYFLCQNFKKTMDVEYIAIIGPEKQLISDREFATNFQYSTEIDDALKGKSFSGVKVSSKNELVVYSIKPVKVGRDVIAAVEVGKNIATDSFMKRFPETVGCEFTIVYKDTRVHTTIKGMDNTKISEPFFKK